VSHELLGRQGTGYEEKSLSELMPKGLGGQMVMQRPARAIRNSVARFGRRQMKSIGSGLQQMRGTSSLQDDQLLAGFEELAVPLFDSLYNFARWLAHNSNDAEDLVQETYLKALRSFASFQRGTNFRAWIFQILRNTFFSSCAKLDRRMTVAMDSQEEGTALPVDMETPETILMNRSNSQLVQRAIDELPVHYREALLLCEVEEMSYREIAEILSIPLGTVMSRLARARRVVRESLRGSSSAPLSGDLPHQGLASRNGQLPTLGRAGFG
jgi:RNA polymerase sigma-70 factor (ECF subfamily)